MGPEILPALSSCALAYRKRPTASLIGYELLTGYPIYFRVNSAFTCAVTVMFCGENCSVGAGAPAIATLFMARAMGIGNGRMFSNESTEA